MIKLHPSNKYQGPKVVLWDGEKDQLLRSNELKKIKESNDKKI
jgi:hypothetical protein